MHRGRMERGPERPAAVIAVCLLDWLVLGGVCVLAALVGRLGGGALPPMFQAALGFLLVGCLLIAALDLACFLMQAWALWLRLILQALSFALFLLRAGPKHPVEWALQVVVMLCWIAALVEVKRSRAQADSRRDRRQRGRPARFGRR